MIGDTAVAQPIWNRQERYEPSHGWVDRDHSRYELYRDRYETFALATERENCYGTVLDRVIGFTAVTFLVPYNRYGTVTKPL